MMNQQQNAISLARVSRFPWLLSLHFGSLSNADKNRKSENAGINYSDVDEKLFLLQQIQSASQDYCRTSGIDRGRDKYSNDDWVNYEDRIKPLVSGYLIGIAAKVRVIQDSFKDEIPIASFKRANDFAMEDIPVGQIQTGDFILDIRETCNKIIHATKAELEWWSRNKSKSNSYTYWTGIIDLSGNKKSKEWKIKINVSAWCVAVDFYLDHLLSHRKV